MENALRESSCGLCGQTFASPAGPDGPTRCALCASRDLAPAARSRSGTVLRHWTTSDRVLVGTSTAKRSGTGDWGLSDSRRRNLVASKLKALAGGTGSI